MVAIVGVTAVLVSEPPASAEVAPTGPYATTAPLGDLELNLVVDPAAAGRNQIHLYLTDLRGSRPTSTRLPSRRRLPSRQIGPLRLQRTVPARATSSSTARSCPRRRLAAPRRGSPRRVRRRDGDRVGPDQKGTPLMKKPYPARARRRIARRPGRQAHVTVNPNEVPADSFSRFAIRVPNETPERRHDQGPVQLRRASSFVSFQPKPGWKRTVTMVKLDKPVTYDEGETVDRRVGTVTWEGGEIAPGEFDEFGLSAKVPDTSRRRSCSRPCRRTRTARSSAGSAPPTPTSPRRGSH